MPVTLWVTEWHERERGWGERFDGFLVALRPEAHEEFLKELRDKEAERYGGRVPDEYSYPIDVPYPVEVERLEYRLIRALNERGRFWSHDRKFWRLNTPRT